MRKCEKLVLVFAVVATLLNQTASAQTTLFSYQGSLNHNGEPANGAFDFELALFDLVANGSQKGNLLSRPGVVVTDGVFTVSLDFGLQFPGANRFLEIRVRPAGGGAFTTLVPRQQILSSPYSITSANATNADQLGGMAADQYVLTGDARLSDARNPLPGSANYVQNRTTQQALSNFNVSGDGTVGGILSGNMVKATTQYNLGATRVLSIAGIDNVFVGDGAGASNTFGESNSFFGSHAGASSTDGEANSFFGRNAGLSNTSGEVNSFFGIDAGRSNTTGEENAFFGGGSGRMNTIGFLNSFFGYESGHSNTTASFNSAFGWAAGWENETGSENAYFGSQAGASSTTSFNAFFGSRAGLNNTDGIANSFFGASSGLGNIDGSNNAFFGVNTGIVNSSGSLNTFIGRRAGNKNTTGSSNTFVGNSSGLDNTTGSNNVAIGDGAGFGDGFLTNATVIGSGAIIHESNMVQLGRIGGLDTVSVPGSLRLLKLGPGGNAICRDISFKVSDCSSSLRYKSNVQTFTGGLNIVSRLRPITFNWKEGGMRDLGFGAEEVEKIEPLLATYNAKGEIEGVKYQQMTSVLVNAINEQQEQIESQQQLIDELKKIICSQNTMAEICQP